MEDITLTINEHLLRDARQYPDERETTLQALIVEHLAVLADRAGRRLTVREQTYVDHRPPGEVIEALRAEGYPSKKKSRLGVALAPPRSQTSFSRRREATQARRVFRPVAWMAAFAAMTSVEGDGAFVSKAEK